MRTSQERRAYMLSRLRLLSEGRELAGTPEEYLARHDHAQVDLLRLRAAHAAPTNNLDLIGG